MKTDEDIRDEEERAGGGFASAFAAALAARKMTLNGLRERLAAHGNPVSLTTLSYWRRGIRHPEGLRSLDAVADIERILGLDQGVLLDRRGASRRPGPVGRQSSPYVDEGATATIFKVLASLGFDGLVPIRELTVSLTIDIGPDGQLQRQTTRALVQCYAGTVTAIPYADILTEPSAEGPGFRALAGGTVGASASDEEGRVHISVVELDHPLVSPQTVMMETEASYAPVAVPSHTASYETWVKVREALLWVRFDPRRPPAWVEEIEETSAGLSAKRVEMTGASIHVVRRSFGPGGLTVRWGFDDA